MLDYNSFYPDYNAEPYRNMTAGQRERITALEIAAKYTVPAAEHLTGRYVLDGTHSVSSMFDSQTMRLAQWIVDGTDRDEIDVDAEDDDA
ncbi:MULTISPECIES: hypothetical protein [Brevibacterium]|uniref:Uncharacterized protein n=1 Tax=Brevibacterium antiquum CNRZ 918 TaxID=1255637 RepID=A0A2H1KD79_9MICO|nr:MULTISPECIES: hypothetical protein [Brevibacterium]SMX97785.1 hypothetical protein BANT918_02358 [Brevibacterium antiquum CNRZ 918]